MEDNLRIQDKIHLFHKGIKILLKTSMLYSILIIVVSALNGLVAPFNAIIYQKFLDSIVVMIEDGKWLEPGLGLLLIFSIINLIGYLSNGLLQFIKQVFSDKLDLYITDKVLNKAISLPMETFDNVKIYNHINMAITQTSTNCLNLLDAVSECVYAVIKGMSFVFIILNFSWQIVVISMLSVLPLLYISLRTNSYWYEVFYKRAEKTRLIEYLKMIMIQNENVKEIKLYGVGEKIINYIKENFTDFLKKDTAARGKILLKKISSQCIDEIVSFGVKLWILVLAIKNGSSLGTIVLYFNSQDNLKVSINELVNQFSTLHNSLLYLNSIDIIEKEESGADTSTNKFSENFEEIEFRNVSFKYPGCTKYVLKNVSLKFKRGKTYSIVGFNGSGKTTLVKLLLKLYKPNEGIILVDGKDIQEFNQEEYYKHISAIFQDFIKYPFDVYDNIVIRKSDDNENRFKEVLNIVGIRKLVNGLPNKEHTMLMRDWTGGVDLSQGQWQKIAIARCIFNDNIISILDEPFSSIDAEAENYIITRLRKNRKEKLTIFITHRFSSISLADQIIVMKEGAVIEEGTHDQLMKNKNIYYKLYTSQILKLKKEKEPHDN